MSIRGKKAWNDLYEIMQDHELTPESYMIKLEVLNLLKKSMPANSPDLDIAILLLVIADSNMRELVER